MGPPDDDPGLCKEAVHGKTATAGEQAAEPIKDEPEELLRNYSDGQSFDEYLDSEVPLWTREPDYVDWYPPDGLELTLQKDTEKKRLEGDAFAGKFRGDYSGPKLDLAEKLFGRL